jgi:LysM repeat protein
MIRTLLMTAAFLAVLPALFFPALPGQAADAATEGTYVVKPGDTLSGIAGKLLDDPARWRDLLEANPQVTDPALIYPGDTLALPGGGGEEPEAIAISGGEEIDAASDPYPPLPVDSVPPEETATAEAEPVEPPLPVELVMPPPVISQAIYRAAGCIVEKLPEGFVVSAVDRKVALGEGDEIFLSVPAEEGKIYTIVRPTQDVFHPKTGQFLGWVLKVMGWAEVNCPGKQASRAVIVNSIDAVNVGDLILPFDPEDVLEENVIGERFSSFCPEKGREGFIVANQEGRIISAGGDIVFLDQGRADGARPGDQFIVYRALNPEGFQVIGQLQLIRVEEHTSTAIVIHSIRELSVSDSIQLWVPPVTDEAAFGG